MKSVVDVFTREELINRINSISVQSKAGWGKMNVFQMLKHCVMCDEMFLGKIKVKRVLIGRLFGKLILKKVLRDDKPFRRNSPTSQFLTSIDENDNIELQKKEWTDSIAQYSDFNNPGFIHPFFGKMSKPEVGILAYKHADHHLRQFGA
ncbi:MAG: DUF1569 domain-containing protein [Ferruginibacter sp.]